MTLDHLVIVGTAIAGVVGALAAGVAPPGAASTAAVKPSTTADAGTIDRFDAVAGDYLARTGTVADLRSEQTNASGALARSFVTAHRRSDHPVHDLHAADGECRDATGRLVRHSGWHDQQAG